jgi:3-oxoadipate enol-lactonase
VTHLAKEVRRPTMVVAGRFDQVRPPAASEAFAQTIPGARFELIDAVHMMPAQASAALLPLLEDFLGAQKTASAARQRAG